MWGTQPTFPWGLPPSHPPDLPPPPPTRSVWGWATIRLFWESWLSVCGGHHCLGEEWGRAENPPNSCLKSGPTLAGVWIETPLPSLGGMLLPSLPSSSDCPPEFRAGVLVTANVCMGLAGRWGFSPLSRAVEPQELSPL
uniref:Uncharacterized protein n=1 Tax=Neovison vison TaxID=452646 RepID=A0A8C7AIP1_NEOVI